MKVILIVVNDEAMVLTRMLEGVPQVAVDNLSECLQEIAEGIDTNVKSVLLED